MSDTIQYKPMTGLNETSFNKIIEMSGKDLAEKSYVDAAVSNLATKKELATKADKSYVDNAISNVTVDTANLATKTELATKVDKVEGKGLSTEDFTTEYKNKLEGLNNNGVSDEQISTAVNKYMQEHPVSSGATTEQAAQIQANKTAIGDSNGGLIKEVNDIKNTELSNLNTAILGVNETLGDKTRLPSGDANVIASINRIDRKTTTGNGLTTEQEQQLRTAYEHSQSPHITTGDVNNAVSTYVAEHKAELKGDNGQDGVTPTLKVGSVTTLEAGNNATVTMSADNNEYTLNFGIPKGAKGDVGASGSGGSSSVANSEWSGKVASFLGDSITYGANTTKTYHQYLKELIGFSTCNNYGIDGASITNHSNGICTRYNNVSSDSDIIFIFGGTNDFYYNKPLGEWYTLSGTTRTLNKDMTTFRGALAVTCDGLITKFPTKQIVLMTPIHRERLNNQQTDLEANASGLYLDDYVECVKEAGRIFGIPVIDLNGESGLYPMNTENANVYFHETDKLHPNADGHLKIARVIQGKLRTILPLDISYTPNVYGNIVLSKTSITMNEGTSNTFTVKLDKAPTNSQTVNISSNNSDVTLSPKTLTFNNSNYSTEQTVTINVTEDSDKTNDNCTITLSSSGVANKTVTLTINDVTVEEPTPDQPSGGTDLTGKSYKLTFNGSQGGYNHVVFVIPKDEDCVSGATLNMKFDINNAVNFPGTCNVTRLQIFNSSTPEVNNGVGGVGGSQEVNQTTIFSNGSASIDFNFTLANTNNNYLKIPYGLKANGYPASIDISNIAVTVNGKPKPIVAVGAFFATESCEVTEL